MSLEQTVQQDLITALKAKDTVAVATLRSLKSALQNETIDTGSLDEERALSIVQKEVKKRDESIATYTEAGREDLAAEESAQREVLAKYLPAQLSEDEIRQQVQQIVAGASTTDFGPLMGMVMGALKNQADGKVVQQVLKEVLQEAAG